MARARPLDADATSVAPSHLANDPSFFEGAKALNFQAVADFNMACDDKLIKSIIEKGRHSNKIAQAMHSQTNLDDSFIIPKGSAEISTKKQTNQAPYDPAKKRRSVFRQ